MSLSSDLLSAYGTCDTIESLFNLPLRADFEQELVNLYCLRHPDRQNLASFIEKNFLLDGRDPKALAQKLGKRADPALLQAQGSAILPEFAFLDAQMRRQNPAYPPVASHLYGRILKAMKAPESFLKPGAEQSANPAFSANPEAPDTRISTDTIPDSAKPAFSHSPDSSRQDALEADLALLQGLTGLQGVKNDIEDLCAMVRIGQLRQARGMKTPPMARHLIFSGNPGTGKTTAARLLARLYKDLGILSKGQLVETDRSGLVGEHVGQTALKTQKVIEKALGGVLFIDEAYALARPSANDFGAEAITTLLKAMEDHRNDLVVIAAGYPSLMEGFLDFNPGLRSRFSRVIRFENYTGPELFEILEKMAETLDYRLDEEAAHIMKGSLTALAANPPAGFANAREVRNLLEKAIARQARRLWKEENPNPEELGLLRAEDFTQ